MLDLGRWTRRLRLVALRYEGSDVVGGMSVSVSVSASIGWCTSGRRGEARRMNAALRVQVDQAAPSSTQPALAASSKGGTALYCIPEPRPSHLENLGENRAGEESGVLDDDIVAFVLERDSDLLKEVVRGFADHHGRHELSADPCARFLGQLSFRVLSRKHSQAPPPGATAASRIVMRRLGRSLASE